MTLNRIMHMYGDKPPLYLVSVCALFLGIGWLIAREAALGSFIGLFIIVHILDACIKSVIFVKNNFTIEPV